MNQQTIRSSYIEEDEVIENSTRLGDAFNKLRDAISKLEIVALNKNQQTDETIDLKQELDKPHKAKSSYVG